MLEAYQLIPMAYTTSILKVVSTRAVCREVKYEGGARASQKKAPDFRPGLSGLENLLSAA